MTETRRPHLGRALPLALIVAVIAAVLLSIPLIFGSERTPKPARTTGAASAAPVVVEPLRDPTPLVAEYGNLRLHLPVDPGDVTAFAYHQAARATALHMKSLVPDGDAAKVARRIKANRGTAPGRKPKTVSAEEEAAEGGVPLIYAGRALRLWRSGRTGPPDTAADCGAKAGSAVYAPLSGKVIGVRRYKLYGKYADYEVHIQPDGGPALDCVLLHVDDVRVRKGDRVIGGVTRIASVRRLSNCINHQLAAYTGDGGDHVHMQLNRLKVPGKLPPLNGPS